MWAAGGEEEEEERGCWRERRRGRKGDKREIGGWRLKQKRENGRGERGR